MGGKLAGIHLSPTTKSAQKQGHPLHETSIHRLHGFIANYQQNNYKALVGKIFKKEYASKPKGRRLREVSQV
jgi:type II secretory pathway component PulL